MAGPWSYSSLSAFESCGRKYYHLRVAKDVVDPPSEQSLWGTRVHEALERRVVDNTPLPVGVEQHEAVVSKLMALPGDKLVEKKLGVTADLTACDFHAAEAWYRGIIDFAVVGEKEALAIDYKTGKVKDNHDQLTLFAGLMLAHYPHIESVRTGYLWLKTGEVTSKAFTRDETGALWGPFVQRVAKLEDAFATNTWTPRPSGLCRGWCPVKMCEYYERVR